jgi:uncharacterized protein
MFDKIEKQWEMKTKTLKRRDFIRYILKTAAIALPAMMFRNLTWAAKSAYDRITETGYYNGLRDLSQLPYFEITDQGRLRLTVDDLEGGIDGHTHLALNGFAGGEPDLLKSYSQTRYYLPPNIKSSLDVYINQNNGAEDKKEMTSVIIGSMTPGGSDVTDTHTIPNLIKEMNLLKIEKAVVLPVRLGFPFGDDMTERYINAIQASGQQDRFILCGGIKPILDDALEKIEEYKQKGLKGIKMHPNFGRFFPNDRQAWPSYDLCGKYDLSVLIHSGRTGFKEKKTLGFKLYTEDYADIGNFEEPIAAFPNTRFVLCHSGAMQNEKAIKIAKANKNVWMDIHGQSVNNIRAMIRELGPERMMYGSDWAFYPESIMIARLLIATENDKTARRMIFADNAKRFWGIN